MERLFGTDGVRGVANSELTPELALKLGRAGARVLAGHGETILVGRDTRISGDMLEAALVAGITAAGGKAVLLGVIPTPGVAYLTRVTGAAAGVVISASHNPVADNGIKFFSGDGYKLPDEVEDQIAAILDELGDVPIGARVGRAVGDPEAWRRYADFLVGTSLPLAGMRILVDCANGAAFRVAPYVLERLGAQVIAINTQPDGVNINVNCGSTHPEQAQQAVRQCRADVGLTHDGDADRLIAIDERGELVDGDHILAICGLELLRQNRLPQNTVVATLYSNMGLELALRPEGGRVLTTKAGDRYVLEAMRENRLALGGEQSGHVIFLEHTTTGDGVLTALQLLSAMRRSGSKLSELASQMQAVPQSLVNVKVKDKAWESSALIQEVVGEAQSRLGSDGRLFVRASGTEPLIRVMAEGMDARLVAELTDKVAAVIRQELG